MINTGIRIARIIAIEYARCGTGAMGPGITRALSMIRVSLSVAANEMDSSALFSNKNT
jgi:hypothetical protein